MTRFAGPRARTAGPRCGVVQDAFLAVCCGTFLGGAALLVTGDALAWLLVWFASLPPLSAGSLAATAIHARRGHRLGTTPKAAAR